MTSLAPADVQKLVKFLGMLGSDHAGERAAAGLKAHQFLVEREVSWSEVIAPRQLPPPRSATFSGGPHQGRALRLLKCGFDWSEWELTFLSSIAAWRGDPTPKQRTRLDALGTAAQAWLNTQGGDCEF
ncbi:MAG: hypothetical protein ABIT09_06700 [Croceibacterium sp.]